MTTSRDSDTDHPPTAHGRVTEQVDPAQEQATSTTGRALDRAGRLRARLAQSTARAGARARSATVRTTAEAKDAVTDEHGRIRPEIPKRGVALAAVATVLGLVVWRRRR